MLDAAILGLREVILMRWISGRLGVGSSLGLMHQMYTLYRESYIILFFITYNKEERCLLKKLIVYSKTSKMESKE